jgi:hypothetical protein
MGDPELSPMGWVGWLSQGAATAASCRRDALN